MSKLSKFIYIFLIVIFVFLTGFFLVSIYNNISLQKKFPKPQIATTSNIKDPPKGSTLKVLSYNIHFATGINNSKINNLDKQFFEKKLDEIAEILSNSDADIVFLQEVDIDSFRSFRINQGKYLAEKAGYSYYAYATYWYRRIFPDINGRHGFLDHGLCILSKYPLINQNVQVFQFSRKIPFFVRWLFNPHGAQKVEALIKDKIVTLINLHLDPWFSSEREKQINKVLKSLKSLDSPVIIGGDFNVDQIEISFNTRPSEQTLALLHENGFESSVPTKHYLIQPDKYHSYPSYNPKFRLDYIFANRKFKIINNKVINKFKDTSDHLPIYVILKLRS